MALTHVVDRYVILSVGTCAIHTAMGIQIFWAIINITSKQVAKIHQHDNTFKGSPKIYQ